MYTHTFFKPNNFDKYLSHLKDKDVHFLEIGSYEGLSANYFCDKFLTSTNSTMTCIDPWIKYSDSTVTKMTEYDNIINESCYDKFLKNIEKNKEKIIIKRDLSQNVYKDLVDTFYDFAYIDGDHSEQAVWNDAINCFLKLKKDGIMIFDDYKWGSGKMSPKKAIDRFLIEYQDKIHSYGVHKNQVIVKKL